MVVVAKATKIDKRSLRDGIFGREKGEGGGAQILGTLRESFFELLYSTNCIQPC